MTDPVESRGVLYINGGESDENLIAERKALEEKLKTCLGWDTINWIYYDYDGDEVE
jgi:hypothetical protein